MREAARLLRQSLGAYSTAFFAAYGAVWTLVYIYLRWTTTRYRFTGDGETDPAALWHSMDWSSKAGVLVCFVLFNWLPLFLTARAAVKITRDEREPDKRSTAGIFEDMFHYVPAALLYSVVIGIPVFIGNQFLFFPGLLLASWLAFSVPAGVVENLAPMAAIRRGTSLVGQVYGEVFGAVSLCALTAGVLLLLEIVIINAFPSLFLLRTFLVWLGLALWLPVLLGSITLTLLFYEARERAIPVTRCG
jgi:hypothetical protein